MPQHHQRYIVVVGSIVDLCGTKSADDKPNMDQADTQRQRTEQRQSEPELSPRDGGAEGERGLSFTCAVHLLTLEHSFPLR